MKFFLKILATALCLLQINAFTAHAQCPPGETEVTIDFNYSPNYYQPSIQWDYVVGGTTSGNGPFNQDDVVTACIPDGDLILVGCDETYNYSWFLVEFTITVTEDGSVNGCGAQDGCILYVGDYSNIPYVLLGSCNFGPDEPSEIVAQLTVGPCDASPVVTTGCTNPAASNYSVCATIDDGSCLLPSANDNCIDAIPIVVEPAGNCPGNLIEVNNAGNTIEYVSSCGIASVDLFYTFIVPPTGAINIFTNSIAGTGSLPGITILDSCNGTEYFCNTISFDQNVENLPVGEELVLHIAQFFPGTIELCIQEAPPGTCEGNIAGQVIAPFDCDLSGIAVVISVINADGTETIIGNATTDANGNYILAGGPFACGDYSAILMLPLPACYADAGGNPGPTGPFTFTVDGDGVADGANFVLNAQVPTLSQWGLISLALLLMIIGSLKMSAIRFTLQNYKVK